jgi:hypothetical protein
LPAPVILYLALYALAVVLVFVSARYRAPVVPVVSLLAAAGVTWLVDSFRAGRSRTLAAAGLMMVLVGAVAVIPGPFCQDEDLEGEYWFMIAAAELRHGNRGRAVESLRRTLDSGHVARAWRYQHDGRGHPQLGGCAEHGEAAVLYP